MDYVFYKILRWLLSYHSCSHLIVIYNITYNISLIALNGHSLKLTDYTAYKIVQISGIISKNSALFKC